MKVASAVVLAHGLLASAFVLPDQDQARLSDTHHHPLGHILDDAADDVSAWWDHLPSADALLSTWDDTVTGLSGSFSQAADAAEAKLNELAERLGHGGHSHEFPHKTIYQVIRHSKYTTHFADLVDKHEKVVKILNGTSSRVAGNVTLFVPIDEAFDKIPEHHKKPSDEFIEDLLLYHVGLGNYPARRVLASHTIPTALNESLLGGEAQRLRARVGLGGVKLNFYSSIVAVNFEAKNGIIHAVRDIIIPPPYVGREISLFPNTFSTLLLAYEKTDFVKFIHKVPMVGSTVFAPSNNAFGRLGPRANAFLFNSETGLKYLTAILKYHIAPNATLYSDAYYEHESSAVESVGSGQHFELTTLLHDLHVGVDVGRVLGFITLRVNGFSHVSVQDGVAKNGVIHVLDKVLIPPHKGHEHEAAVDDDISVMELKERLEDYLE